MREVARIVAYDERRRVKLVAGVRPADDIAYGVGRLLRGTLREQTYLATLGRWRSASRLRRPQSPRLQLIVAALPDYAAQCLNDYECQGAIRGPSDGVA